MFDEAIQYYLAAADDREAARLISLTAEESFLKPDPHLVEVGGSATPAQLALNPELAVQRAWAHFCRRYQADNGDHHRPYDDPRAWERTKSIFES